MDESGELLSEERVYYVSNGWTLEEEAAAQWFQALTALEAESAAAAETQGREELLSVAFRRDSESWPEVTLELWGYDSARCLCGVNGEDYYFVSRTEAEALAAAGEELLVIE